MHLSEPSTNNTTGLKLQDALFADLMGTVTVTLWQEHIPMIEIGKVCSISPIQICSWQGKLKLNTVPRSQNNRM